MNAPSPMASPAPSLEPYLLHNRPAPPWLLRMAEQAMQEARRLAAFDPPRRLVVEYPRVTVARALAAIRKEHAR